MVLVLAVVELAAVLAETVGLVVALRLQDEAGLKQCAAGVGADVLEPAPELLVATSVIRELLDGVVDAVHALAVGKALE